MFRLLGFSAVSKVPPLTGALFLSLLAHWYLFVLAPDSRSSQLMAKQGVVGASLTLNNFRARAQPLMVEAPVAANQAPTKTKKKAIMKKPVPLHKPKRTSLKNLTARKLMAIPAPLTPSPDEPRQLKQHKTPAPISVAQRPEQKAGIVTRAARYREQPPAPVYPKLALKRRQSGEVLLRLLIGRLGNIEASKVIRSSGFKLLDRAALASVRRWKFEPWMESGIAQQSWVEVPVDFTIKRR